MLSLKEEGRRKYYRAQSDFPRTREESESYLCFYLVYIKTGRELSVKCLVRLCPNQWERELSQNEFFVKKIHVFAQRSLNFSITGSVYSTDQKT